MAWNGSGGYSRKTTAPAGAQKKERQNKKPKWGAAGACLTILVAVVGGFVWMQLRPADDNGQ